MQNRIVTVRSLKRKFWGRRLEVRKSGIFFGADRNLKKRGECKEGGRIQQKRGEKTV